MSNCIWKNMDIRELRSACVTLVQSKVLDLTDVKTDRNVFLSSDRIEVKSERNGKDEAQNNSSLLHRRQNLAAPGPPTMPNAGVKKTTTTLGRKQPPDRPAFEDQCDHIVAYCLRAYVTGAVCARTYFFRYRTFSRYCEVDWTNCKLRYEVWQIVHMGECYKYTMRPDCREFTYEDNMEDMWLDQLWLNDSS